MTMRNRIRWTAALLTISSLSSRCEPFSVDSLSTSRSWNSAAPGISHSNSLFVESVPTELSSQNDNHHQDNNDDSNDAQLVQETFTELYNDVLPEWLLERLSDCGWTRPTVIQKEALDVILRQQEDVVIQAQTGSGKTLSFLLPILAHVDPTRAAVQALIVVPSRELGLQVGRVAKRLAANSATIRNNSNDDNDNEEIMNDCEADETETTVIPTAGSNNKIMIMTVLQGSQNRRQRAWAWAEPPQVVIGTPEELCIMVRLGGIKRYNSVKYLVVDEVDACLLNNAGTMSSKLSSSSLHELLSKYLSPTYDDGDPSTSSVQEDSNGVLRNSPNNKPRPVTKTRQTIFCSATIPQHRHFMKQCVQNQWILSKTPQHICLRGGEQLVPPTLDHAYMVCASSERKLAALRRLLKKIIGTNNDGNSRTSRKKILVFAEPQRPLEEMAQVVAKDLGEDSLLWKEINTPEDEVAASAIVGVLRFEDSLSQRAAAIQGFTGTPTSRPWEGQNRHTPISTINDNPSSDSSNDGKPRILFSSDLAARGLDIEGITHVIQFDLAPDADTYVHRSGRTARCGASGQVVSIITPEQEFVLNRLANKLFLGDAMECIARQKGVTDKKTKR